MTTRGLFAVSALSLIVTGCGTMSLPPAPWSKSPAPTPTIGSTSGRAAAHRVRAEELERRGALREAHAAWSTALSLEPGHVPTQQAVRRVRARIDREVADHLQRARLAAAEARRHYAAALALDPDSRTAKEGLRTAPPCPGCRDEAPAVASATPRPEPPRPEPPRPEPLRTEAEPPTSVTLPRPPATVSAPRPVTAAPRSEPLRTPSDDPETMYNAAIDLLAEGRDDDAYRVLTQLRRVKGGYKDSAMLVRNVRAKLARQHYQEGLRLFREEKLEQAIGEWRIVLEIDPRDVNARRNIEQAQRMLRTLAEEQKR